VYLALAPVDMRKGHDGLAALVQQVLQGYPFCGHLFLFRPKRAGRLKLLWRDGSGLCLFAKRLEKGRFVWPRVEEGAITLTRAQLAMLIEGPRLAACSCFRGLADADRGVVEASEAVVILPEARSPARGPGAKYCDNLPLYRQSLICFLHVADVA
jgi:transposase